MLRRRFFLLLLAGTATLAGAGGYAYWVRGARRAAAYVTEVADRGPLVLTVTATGTVNPVTTVQVGTYVSGPIQALDVDFNTPVTKGQRVAKIDPSPFLVKVRRAEADVATARARVEKARADLALKRLVLERNTTLRGQQLVSQQDIDTARSDYDQARAQVALEEATVTQVEASLQEARINLGYTDIVSPVDGVVVSRNVDVGQTVAASFQTPTLFLIAQDLTHMQVNTAVSEADIGEVQVGQPTTFSVDAYPGRAFHGTVTQVRNAPKVLQNVVTYDVVIGVENPDLTLKPGMTASVVITTAERRDVLRVPQRALRFRPQQTDGAADGRRPRPTEASSERPTVWVVQTDGILRPVVVRLGLRNDQYAEVVEGDVVSGDRLAVAYEQTARKPPQPPGGLVGGRRPR
jgi:HlyD family secretion protein